MGVARFQEWWPADGQRTLGGALLFAGGVGAWAAAALPAPVAGGLCLAGLTLLAIQLRRQACDQRLAADLCQDAGVRAAPLHETLPRLAARLRAVDHRLMQNHPVTGLPTRERFFGEIATDLLDNDRPRLIGAIRFVDFDRLAAFDLPAANAALERFAARLVAAAGARHTVAQIDRDGFCIWLRCDGDLATARAEFRAMVYVAGQEIESDAGVLTPTIEIGTATYPEDGLDAAQLVLRVTAALARLDASGAKDVALIAPPSMEAAREQFMLEQDLAQAIVEEQLTMVFQPVVDLAAGRVIGAEALLRWDHPRLGSVSPARFIPVVEAIGMSERYGLWVLNAACREARQWRDIGLVDLKVAVNLSARQLIDPGLKDKVTRTLQRHGLDARALELELTETAAMADAGRTLALFAELRAMGVSLAIDDFGSGYSSLSYLKNLPFDKLKIDREFVADVDKRRDSRAICKALIELGRGLDLLVLAEGVETSEEVETLRELGCTVFQGYHFSRPLSGDQFRQLAADPVWRTALAQPASPPFFEDRLSA